ncbi:MAG: HlyC/CorC family transporter [Anaeromyxobacter sp.]|nr:HlyC/CorC family transporter [Anaeromyxobacter sp.]MBL0275181.1 HlyC/CorC family transporter [Anaeromyxobacter sp.]
MDPQVTKALQALGAVLLLVVLRALAAAVEAALVATGQPRALALGAPPGATRRARCLAALARDPEGTGATIRVVETSTVLLAGLMSGTAGVLLFPDRAAFAAGLLAALLGAALSLLLAAVGRGLGAAHGEAVALALAVPVRGLRVLLRPVGQLLALLGAGHARFTLPRPPLAEMERALSEYAKAQGQGAATSELIHAVFEFREKVARDVMVPRTEVLAVELGTPVPEILRLLAEEGHSRVPVYREHLDQIVGVLHARDLVPLLASPELILLGDLLRPAHFVPWSKPVEQLLRELQRKKLHMALVVDEYGGVMGLCTLEDVLEQIVGEIHDEFDAEEGRAVEPHPDGSFTVVGSTPLAEFNRAAGADLPEDGGVETLAGFLNSIAGAIPARGDRFFWRGWVFTVSEADPRKVTRVRAARAARPSAEGKA